MKLFGTHVYPKNKYLTLQLTRSAKGVMCEDIFESLVSACDRSVSFLLYTLLANMVMFCFRRMWSKNINAKEMSCY